MKTRRTIALAAAAVLALTVSGPGASAVDPGPQYPADACQSVTIIAPNVAFADALAKGVFILGPVEGMALAEKLEGVQALIVAADGTVTLSKGLRK
jgi:thiamine biosynthesis lipoprotein